MKLVNDLTKKDVFNIFAKAINTLEKKGNITKKDLNNILKEVLLDSVEVAAKLTDNSIDDKIVYLLRLCFDND